MKKQLSSIINAVRSFRFRVYVPEACEIPKGYGITWYEPINRWRAVCFPIPFNWLMGWAFLSWIFIRRGPAGLIYKVDTWLTKK